MAGMSSEKGGERRCSTLESSAMAYPLLDLPPGPAHPFQSQSSMFSNLASFTALLNGKPSDEEVKGCSSAQLQHQLSWESHDLSPPTNPNQFNGDDDEDEDDDVGCTERSEMEVSSKVSSSAMPNIMMGGVCTNPMMEGNLFRYNSAPSSMMDFRDKFFGHTTPASFVSNNNNNSLSQLNPKPFPQHFKPLGGGSIEETPPSAKRLRPIMHHPSPPPPPPPPCKVVVGGNISHGSLSAVLEDGEEDTKYRQIVRNELGGSSVSSSSVDFAALPQLRSGLIRHSSSPAGLISRVTSEIGEMSNPSSNVGGGFSGGGGQGPLPGGGQAFVGLSPGFAIGGCFGSNREVNSDLNSSVLLRRMDSCPAEFSSRGGGGGGLEVPTLSSAPTSSDSLVDRRGFNCGGGGGGRSGFLGSFPVASWEDAVLANGNLLHGMHEGSSSINLKKREISQLDQNMSARSLFQRDVYDSGLGGTNQFTLTSGNGLGGSSSSPEKLLSDCTPCQARAKRGCATHPRSIAERVRRTKISERMKKLQELVPNMDKQTNTAEMLDEVVDYVKSLQQEVKELGEKASLCDGSCKKVKTDSSS